MEFLLPTAIASLGKHALVAFVPHPSGDHSQTGIIGCTVDGQVRYWENVAFGPLHFKHLVIRFPDDDLASFLIGCEPVGLIVGTMNSAVISISLFDANGMSNLSYSPLQRSSDILSRVTSLFGYGSKDADVSAVSSSRLVCIIPGKLADVRNTREIYVLSETSLQKWIISKTQDNRLVAEIDIKRAIMEHLDSCLEGDTHNDLLVRIEDADYSKLDEIVLLVGFSELRESYNYLLIKCKERNQVFELDADSHDIQFSQLVHSAAPLSLSLAAGGPFFFIHSADMVLLSVLSDSVDFEDVLPFKNAHGRILGLSASSSGSNQRQSDSSRLISAHVMFMTQDRGVIQIDIDPAAVFANFEVVRQSDKVMTQQQKERATQQAKARLEQAIFYGGVSDDWSNPIDFDIGVPEGVNLNSAFVELSRSIMESSNPHIRAILDPRVQIGERIHRLERILHFLHMRNLVSKVSADSRFQLSLNAERLIAGESLWRYLNSIRGNPDAVRKNKKLMLLEDSIQAFMVGRLTEADPIKDFFEHQLAHLDVFIGFVVQRVLNRAQSLSDGDARLEIFELNKIVLLSVPTALEYRRKNAERYCLLDDVLFEPWTATESIVIALYSLFDTNSKLVQGSGSLYPAIREEDVDDAVLIDLDDPTPHEINSKLTSQLCELADTVMNAFHERISLLKSVKPIDEQRLTAFKEQYEAVQPMIIKSLVSLGRPDQAFRLSEKYKEFQSLVDLCLENENKNSRIREYVHRFGQDFTAVLYGTYYKRGQYRDLLDQPAEYREHLDAYLQEADIPFLSWIQDISTGKLDRASATLWKVAEQCEMRESQTLALSLSKLASIESCDNIDAFFESQEASAFSRAEEFITLQTDIMGLFLKSSSAGLSENANVDEKVNHLMRIRFSRIHRSKVQLAKLVKQILRSMLRGVKLTPFDMLELLTAHDHTEDGVEMFVSALELFARYIATDDVESLAKQHEQAFCLGLIWVRAWLDGKWKEVLSMLRESSSENAVDALKKTAVFGIVSHFQREYRNTPSLLTRCLPPPDQLSFDTETDLLKAHHSDLSEGDLKKLKSEYSEDFNAFKSLLPDKTMLDIYNECNRIVSDSSAMDTLE